MNGPEVITSYRHQLAGHIAGRDAIPKLQQLPISPWQAMSLLQKAIRRGREDLALRAAATLLVDAPDRLWRRLGGIAFEDVGLANIDTVGLVTAALGGKRVRAALGGEWRVAAFLASAMTKAHKCRAADNLLMNAELHPALASARHEFERMPTRQLLEIASGPTPIVERGLALWFAIGTDRRPSKHLPLRRGEPQVAFDFMCEAGLPHSVVEVAREGFRKTGEVLAPFVALLSQETRGDPIIASDDFPPEAMVGDVPGWCLDIYTREGRAAFTRVLKTDSPTARWIRAHVAPDRRVGFLGGIVFRVEGSALKNRLRWPLGEELRLRYEIECVGRECSDASEIMELVREDIPTLNGVRAELNGGSRHV